MILLAGPLLLFNPWFVSALQSRHAVAADLGAPMAEVDRVTGALLGDVFTGGAFDAALDAEPVLDEAERSHMADVSRLVRVLVGITLAAILAAALTGRMLRGEPVRMARILVLAASAIGAAALVLAIVFAVAFEAAFLAFHALFFPPGTYLFAAGSDLIRLFPEGFWFDASLVAGVTVISTAAIVGVIGLRGLKRPPTPRPAG